MSTGRVDIMQLHLNAQQIYEKDFKTGLRGYNPDEVDNFLDMIIDDYRKFEAYVKNTRLQEAPSVDPKLQVEALKLQQENRRLQQELATVKQELARAQSEQPPVRRTQSIPTGTTNFDILQRLSNLEKHVFGSRLDQEWIVRTIRI